MRYRKSIKICKGIKVNFSKSGASLTVGRRGHTVNFSQRGIKETVGIPGTGVSDSRYLYKNASGGKGRPMHTTIQFVMRMNEQGHIKIEDESGNEIIDSTMLRKIRATPQFKMQKEHLETQRRQKIDEIIKNSAVENEKFIDIYKQSATVRTKEKFLQDLEKLHIKEFIPEEYLVPKPNRAMIRSDLENEAQRNVKGIFGKKRRQKAYVDEKFEQRVETAISTWENSKKQFDLQQKQKREMVEREYREEYQNKKHLLTKLLEGDSDAICNTFDAWIENCTLPVEIDINYDWDSSASTMMLDVDLPEIEDLPQKKMIKTDGGTMKEKKKTQTELRGEYATLVLGLAEFIASYAFNISPAILKILISGYTQRRNKNGDLNDDYIYSLKFIRDKFENQDLSHIMPQDFCKSFENRCNMTSTSLFRTIKPYETF